MKNATGARVKAHGKAVSDSVLTSCSVVMLLDDLGLPDDGPDRRPWPLPSSLCPSLATAVDLNPPSMAGHRVPAHSHLIRKTCGGCRRVDLCGPASPASGRCSALVRWLERV